MASSEKFAQRTVIKVCVNLDKTPTETRKMIREASEKHNPWPHFTTIVADNVTSNHVKGVAASHVLPGIIYALNGRKNGHEGRPEIYALNETGNVIGTFTLHGATHHDWLDIAVAPWHPGAIETCVYIADTGNGGEIEPLTLNMIYKIPETAVITNHIFQRPHRLHLNWHHNNCQAMMVDPGANVYLISTERELVKLPFNGWDEHKVDVEQLGTVAIMGHPRAADISPDGSEVLIETEGGVVYWNAGTSRNYASLVQGQWKILPQHAGPLGGSMRWDYKGEEYYTLSEGSNMPSYHYVRT